MTHQIDRNKAFCSFIHLSFPCKVDIKNSWQIFTYESDMILASRNIQMPSRCETFQAELRLDILSHLKRTKCLVQLTDASSIYHATYEAHRLYILNHVYRANFQPKVLVNIKASIDATNEAVSLSAGMLPGKMTSGFAIDTRKIESNATPMQILTIFW